MSIQSPRGSLDMKVDKGALLGHYEIVAALGKGGMGEVYLAQDTRLARFALKILPAEFAVDSDRLHRSIRDAKSATTLNHPNIITVYDIGEAAGTPFIAYEFVDGTTLSERVRHASLNIGSSLEIAIQLHRRWSRRITRESFTAISSLTT